MIERVAYISMHTSPLLQPGLGDAGGMNVYLDRLAKTMVDRGVDVTVFTRRADPDWPHVVEITEGYRVVHIDAGPVERLPTSALIDFVDAFARNVLEWIEQRNQTFDIVHSHYWLSGRTGVRVKDRLSIPLANSFHTLGKVKDLARASSEPASPSLRLITEEEVIGRSDCVIASTPFEFDDLLEHYAASPERLCVSPPGVDHALFRPGSRAKARRDLGLDPDAAIVLYAGRIQAHKGTNLAVEAFAELPRTIGSTDRTTLLNVVGGPSGPDGSAELARCAKTVDANRMERRVRFFDPVPHADLVRHYQAADVVIVPSRTETFGLVAAEAQACGVPVVASNRGGLPYVVRASETGLLVDGEDPRSFAAAMKAVLEHPAFAQRLGRDAEEFSRRFSWDATATRLLELYDGIRSALDREKKRHGT
ncbi:MAG: glycosyltransferase [Acidimicrobiia bacterium]|nr:glycosyltransferase [Acidimicrobiia bacterium]